MEPVRRSILPDRPLAPGDLPTLSGEPGVRRVRPVTVVEAPGPYPDAITGVAVEAADGTAVFRWDDGTDRWIADGDDDDGPD